MALFQRPLDPATVTATVVQASLPDRLADPPDPGLVHYARYPELVIRFLSVLPVAPATTISFSWPVTAAIRQVDLPAADAATLGVPQLIELSPLPFALTGILRVLGPGVPTFYVGLSGVAVLDQDSLAQTSDPPISAQRVVIGCIFQDRMTLEPQAWIDIIANALSQAAPADEAGWRSLSNLFAGARTLAVRDHAGQPLANEPFGLRFLDASGNVIREVAANSGATGLLGAEAFPRPGEDRVEISWQPAPLLNDEILPVLALYEPSLADATDDTTRTFPGAPALSFSASAGSTHLQVTDLARWYAPVVVSPGNSWPARFRPDSHVEPLVDGLITYTRLVADIRRASGIHLAGWAFDEFPMRPYDPASTLVSLLDEIGRDKFRLLVTRSFQPRVGALDGVGVGSLAAIMIAMLAAEPLIATQRLGNFNGWGIFVWHVAAILILAAEILADPDANVEDLLREKAEFTHKPVREKLYDVTGGKPNCAFPAPHPATMSDNPLGHDFTLPLFGQLSNLQNMWGVYHMKMQVLAIPQGTGSTYVGYLGGVDINSNRVDSPGHHAAAFRRPDSTAAPASAPYHDVHARITGPAVLDVAGIFHERYQQALTNPPSGVVGEPLFIPPAVPPPPAFAPPADLPAKAGQHLVRVAQTSYKPAVAGAGLPWSPDGDAPIRETFERAIKSASEYIYIEDQYFTLDDGLIRLLRQAADHCRRLVITVPAGTPDQLFGDQRRLATFERLAGATGGPGGWGDRMVVGTPYRRPVLPPAEQTASVGRASLVDKIESATASKIYVGPPSRVPKTVPYFFYVAGELMYATKASERTSPGGKPAMEIEVLRGGASGTGPQWCPHPRIHAEGTPVTFSAPRDIFVHAKLLMVDDMFVGIGSCNWNRRGFYHDGEADVFAIPDRLKAAQDNPAFLLRTALWAEHLGLTPFMGRSLLADPVEAFELFRRTFYEGNRHINYRLFLAPRGDLQALNDAELMQLLPDAVRVTLIASANSFVATEIHNIWNTLFDPTTRIDPNPTEGPEL
jgi:phosphatidylserine/phosphatidylglycerophosphate/cardiolipin synthase-like enzyme